MESKNFTGIRVDIHIAKCNANCLGFCIEKEILNPLMHFGVLDSEEALRKGKW